MSHLNPHQWILDELAQIPPAQLGRLAEIIHYYRLGLQAEWSSTERKGRFSRHSGVLSDEEAQAMRTAIEVECERIDPNGW